MGLLVDGQWHDQWYDTSKSGGRFIREEAQFRHWVTPDGAPGPSGEGGFPAESGRYHLYVSMACPWAHRTLIFRKLKGLEEHISVSAVHPDMLSNGWEYQGPALDSDTEVGDQLFGHRYHHELYTRTQPDYTGRVTVPVLWDRKRDTMVSNESAEIIRMLNSAFDGLTGNTTDYYPEDLRPEIDRINERVYHTVNNGVYKTGFATTQEAYEEAFDDLFDSLKWLDNLLGERRYLAGDRTTEADWRLFTTLVRFDAVYVGHFKCNLRRIDDYPNLGQYLRELYQVTGIAGTVDMVHIKRHYYYSHDTINPTRVVPKGPALNLEAPHDRSRL